jgi:hypothetical protein
VRPAVRRKDDTAPWFDLFWIVTEPELHANLVMLDFPVDDVAFDLADLEPIEIPQSLSRGFDAEIDGIADAILRCANNLGDAINMIAH